MSTANSGRPKAHNPKTTAGIITRLSEPNIIRDRQISQLGTEALEDGAIIAIVIYETADHKLKILSHDGSWCTAKGLLQCAYEEHIKKEE